MNFRSFARWMAVLLFSAALDGQQAARNPQKEKLIVEKLAAIAPAAVETFQRGTEAMDKQDYATAVQLYSEVTKQAPTFSPAVRRLGLSRAGLGQTDDALKLLESAVSMERSPENLISLAQLLAYPSEGKQGTEAQKQRALTLAKEASDLYRGSDDPSYSWLTANIALEVRNEEEFRRATETLMRKYPNLMVTHYCNAIRSAMDEKWIAAEDEIKKAERLGLPAEAVQAFLASGVHSRATAWRWVHYVLFAVAAWASGLFLLFAAGKISSKLTLHFINTSDPNSRSSPAQIMLRRFYRSLINVAGSYYYVSIPVVIFLVLAVTASIVYGFLVLGRVPIKLVGILVIGAIVTVVTMVRSLFIKVNSEDPGRSLGAEEAPALWALTREVAESLRTRPLDEIRVLPGTEMAVYERGSYRERRKDLGRRILLMGLGLLPGFSQNSFRAILAHEYGHLSHRDTAGGDIALRVNHDMMKFAYAMAYAGQAVWWNLAFQFLRLYHFLFRRISYGATRLQEVLADRAAAQIYGARSFEEGLRHVVRRNIEFDHCANKEIKEALKAGRALQNVYTLRVPPGESLEEAVNNSLNRPTSEDDTHPSPVERFRLVSGVACQTQLAPSASMWGLFAGRDAIANEMSSEIEKMVKAATA